jgi:predicted ArsR family transcriptional regulator
VSTTDPGLRRARALADPNRFSIYRRIVDAPGPVDIATLTEAVGLHHTAVRQHLAKLREAELVLEEPLPAHGRGRPRLGYRPNPAAGVVVGDDPYRNLALMLAEAVRTGDTAREVGRREGRRSGTARKAAGGDGVQAIVDETAQLGFRPRLQPDGQNDVAVVLQACPFADVAAVDPATVCQLHLGLAEGLAEAVGGVSVSGFHVEDPFTAGCELTLHTKRRRRP